jgi:hypothetical protein
MKADESLANGGHSLQLAENLPAGKSAVIAELIRHMEDVRERGPGREAENDEICSPDDRLWQTMENPDRCGTLSEVRTSLFGGRPPLRERTASAVIGGRDEREEEDCRRVKAAGEFPDGTVTHGFSPVLSIEEMEWLEMLADEPNDDFCGLPVRGN